jgi:hypothetical protein
LPFLDLRVTDARFPGDDPRRISEVQTAKPFQALCAPALGHIGMAHPDGGSAMLVAEPKGTGLGAVP